MPTTKSGFGVYQNIEKITPLFLPIHSYILIKEVNHASEKTWRRRESLKRRIQKRARLNAKQNYEYNK